MRGYGSFLDPNHIEVEVTKARRRTRPAPKKVIKFKQCIIAAGSAPLPCPSSRDDPRIVDSTGALELRTVCRAEKMLVIGGGIIGLEMATVYSTLGARIDVVEMMDGLMQGPDRDAVKVWEKQNAHRFDNIMLKTKTVAVEAKEDGLYVKFEGEGAPTEPVRYDMILQSAGRSPNGKEDRRREGGRHRHRTRLHPVDAQMRTNVPHIFAIGDLVGQPMLAHKAVHEAHVAAEVAAGHKAAFDATVIPGVAYTHPEVAWVGYTEARQAEGKKVGPPSSRGRLRPRHRQRRRLRLHQADLRRRDAPRDRRHHRRAVCRRHDRRVCPGHRDGLRRGRHRQDHPPAPDPGRDGGHGSGSSARQLYRCAGGAEEVSPQHDSYKGDGIPRRPFRLPAPKQLKPDERGFVDFQCPLHAVRIITVQMGFCQSQSQSQETWHLLRRGAVCVL